MTEAVVVPDESCPYKFLDYYEEPDRAMLGGRDQDAMEWASRLAYHRTCVLYGKSGLGKTSLLLAGVFPLLRERGYQPVYVRTLADPTNDLLTSICSECGISAPSMQDLNGVLRIASNRRAVVIVFDQFEEFFIRFEGSPIVREAFIKAVSGAVDDPNLDLRILFSLREDYLARMNDFSRHLPALLDSAYQLLPLTAFGVRQSITRPLMEAGIEYDQRLVASLVDELAPFDFDPPLLQIVCTEVYRHAAARTPENVGLSESDLRQVGGIEGIFRKYLSEAISRIPREHHLVLRTVLDALITVERTKQAATLDALLKGDFIATAEEVGAVLSLLVSQRVVRKISRGSQAWYELIHDRLVPIILEWLELDQEFFKFRIAKQLVKNCCLGEAWRGQPDALLNEGQLNGVVGPYKERLQLTELESEFVLRSILYGGCEDASYWADRYGYDRSLQILLSLLASNNDAVRLGAALSARRVSDLDGKLAATCLELSLGDSNEDIRRAAGGSLASLAQQEHLEALKQARARRTTRRNALEVLADLFAQGGTLKEFSRYSRWRAELIAKRRVYWSNICTLRKESYEGAVVGLLAAIFWTLTVFASLATLAAWALGLGTSGWEYYAVLGSVTVCCLLIAMLLGSLIGWHSAASLTKSLLWSGSVRWEDAIRHDWPLKILLFAVGIVLFSTILFSHSIEFAVISSLGLPAGGTYLISLLNKTFRWEHASWHAWCVGILLFLTSVALFLFVLPNSYRGLDIYHLQDDNLSSFIAYMICGIVGRVVGIVGLSVLATHLAGLAIAAYMRWSSLLVPSIVTRLGPWKWAFVGCVGLPLLVPVLLTTVILATIPLLSAAGIVRATNDSVFAIVVGATLVGLLGSLCSVTITVVMAKNVSHLRPDSKRAGPSTVWARRLAIGFPLTLVVWYVGTFGSDTIPVLAQSMLMLPGKSHRVTGNLTDSWPDTDYFKIRFPPEESAYAPHALMLTSPRRTSIRVGDETIGIESGKSCVAVFYGRSQMLSLSSLFDPPPILHYDVSVTSIPLIELQENQGGQKAHQGIYLQDGKISLASCRLTWHEERTTISQKEKPSQSKPAVHVWWQGDFEGQFRNRANGQFTMFLPQHALRLPRMQTATFTLEAVSSDGGQRVDTVTVSNYVYKSQAAELSWRGYSSKQIRVPVDGEGKWKFTLRFEPRASVLPLPDGQGESTGRLWESFGLPEFVDIFAGFSPDADPRGICWP